jgi:diadenosine tetraphosphate (Ap4A) HIT family hydrolase
LSEAACQAVANCVLCDTTGGDLVWQDARCRVIVADEPDYPGFVRVVWQAHVAESSDLTVADRQHLLAVVDQVERVTRAVMTPDKINLAALGNVVPHLHWHVIPRFRDDAHFPAPIWAESVRTVAPVVQQARRSAALHLPSRLHDSLQSELH